MRDNHPKLIVNFLQNRSTQGSVLRALFAIANNFLLEQSQQEAKRVLYVNDLVVFYRHKYIDSITEVLNSEIKSIVQSTRKGGKDKNHSLLQAKNLNSEWKNISSASRIKLLALYNSIWNLGIYPKNWKIFIIIPILKNTKPCSDLNNYRPWPSMSNLKFLALFSIKDYIELHKSIRLLYNA